MGDGRFPHPGYPSRPVRPHFPKLLAGLVLLTGLLTVMATPVAAATPRRTWNATIGTSRVLGSATVTLYPNFAGNIRVSVQGLNPSTTYAASIYKGTCRAPIVLVRLPGVRTDAAGNGSRTTALTANGGTSIWATAVNGSVAIRVSSGSAAYCARLSYPLATRVQIARYGIDLPIVFQPTGTYPYCNVAMFSSALSQPGEAGPTFIYAHARVGMFLPLLTASQVNASAMVGTIVRVWTSDNRVHTYRFTRVLRHQYAIPAFDPRVETFWLQTSEGPHGTKNKLFIVGTRVSTADASYSEAHPKAHIVVCH